MDKEPLLCVSNLPSELCKVKKQTKTCLQQNNNFSEMIINIVKLLSTQMKRETKIIKEVNTQDALLNF